MARSTEVLSDSQKKTLKGVVKTQRTAAEIGQKQGKSGRGVARDLNALIKLGFVKKHDGRLPKYTKID